MCLNRTVRIQMFGLPTVAGCPNLHLAASEIPRGTSYLKKIKFNLQKGNPKMQNSKAMEGDAKKIMNNAFTEGKKVGQ